MSVNVAAGHLLMAPDFAVSVAAVLSATDTRPELLTLEVTEGVFVDDGEPALVVLTDLHQLGVKLALDDFGTGYSSLSYLRRFPIDIVKIDQAYIADLEQDLAGDAIVVAVIDLAHRLGQTVVAEGVETAAQHRELMALGCDASQGYYFARPMAADDLETLMQERDVHGAVHLPALAASGVRAGGSLAVALEPARAPLPR
jgi:EAL domain-containing protein (putative c-di-GMP-specific phosphodiesterase class I)